MKAVMVMFDSLNRRFLPPYGCGWVKAPNFERLMSHSVCFDNAYAGSLPCMPARRELHSGRYNFMHRGWGPLEPFDDSMPELLDRNGVLSHLISDHQHYWEDGGATYHTRYSSWECVRGQEGDHWKGNLASGAVPDTIIPDQDPSILAFKARLYRQDAVNRTYRSTRDKSCQREVFNLGCEFIETNHGQDNWFVQIESFDPHEPFFTYEEYLDLYDRTDIGRQLDWPPYDRVHEGPEVVSHIREKYAAMISMCDDNLGRVLDLFDKYDLWKDTMLIVNTDHGYMLGEHGWWAKNNMPCFSEIVNIPLFIWDPRSGKSGIHRKSLVQTIDLPATILSYFGIGVPGGMQGRDLAGVMESDTPVRTHALFGYFGKQMNITDGRHVYIRNTVDRTVPLYEYTLMPLRMSWRMGSELESTELAGPFGFTKGMGVLKIRAGAPDSVGDDRAASAYGSMLFDLESDPGQERPLDDPALEAELAREMTRLMIGSEAPSELYDRMGLAKEKEEIENEKH